MQINKQYPEKVSKRWLSLSTTISLKKVNGQISLKASRSILKIMTIDEAVLLVIFLAAGALAALLAADEIRYKLHQKSTKKEKGKNE